MLGQIFRKLGVLLLPTQEMKVSSALIFQQEALDLLSIHPNNETALDLVETRLEEENWGLEDARKCATC